MKLSKKGRTPKIILTCFIAIIIFAAFVRIGVNGYSPEASDGLVWNLVGNASTGCQVTAPAQTQINEGTTGTFTILARFKFVSAIAGDIYTMNTWVAQNNLNFGWDITKNNGQIQLHYQKSDGTQISPISSASATTYFTDGFYHEYALTENFGTGAVTFTIDGVTKDSYTDGMNGATWYAFGSGASAQSAIAYNKNTQVYLDAFFIAVSSSSVSAVSWNFDTTTFPTGWGSAFCTTAARLTDTTAITATSVSSVTVVTTSTATLTTTCFGACGSITTVSIAASKQYLYWTSFQNPLSYGATVTNLTTKVSSVNINNPSGALFLGVWTANGAPSLSNPYKLIFSQTVYLNNGSTNQLLSYNPSTSQNVQVCAACWVAYGLMANTTKSNSASITGSGIAIYTTNVVPTPIWYDLNLVGQTALPTTFFGGNGPDVPYYEFIKLTYPINTFTTTTTVTAASTTTVTSTTVSTNVINQPDASKSQFWYTPLMYLFIFFGLFSGAGMLVARRGSFG